MWRLSLLLVAAVGCLGASSQFQEYLIVGGEIVPIDEIPYQLQLEDSNRLICGASVIGEYWALTAAHCVYRKEPESIQLRSGSSFREKGGVLHQAAEIKIHEKFDTSIADYDVAIVRVEKPFEKHEIIAITKMRPETGAMATISGWGRIKEGGASSEELRLVHVPIFDQEKCKLIYGDSLTDRMICAGYEKGGKDACQGDSGGPLVVDNRVAGIISKGIGCAREEPEVCTDVAALHDWIVENAGLEITPKM